MYCVCFIRWQQTERDDRENAVVVNGAYLVFASAAADFSALGILGRLELSWCWERGLLACRNIAHDAVEKKEKESCLAHKEPGKQIRLLNYKIDSWRVEGKKRGRENGWLEQCRRRRTEEKRRAEDEWAKEEEKWKKEWRRRKIGRRQQQKDAARK